MTSKVMMVPPPAPERIEVPKWKIEDLSTIYEKYLIIKFAKCFESTLFEDETVAPAKITAKRNRADSLTGSKRMLQDLF